MPVNIVEQIKSASFILAILFGILWFNEPAHARGDIIDLCVYPKTTKAGEVIGVFYLAPGKPSAVKIPPQAFVAADETKGYVSLREKQSSKEIIGWVKMKDLVKQDQINCQW